MKSKIFSALLLVISLSCSSDKETARRDFFKAKGIEITKGRVIAWFPKDSLDAMRMNAIVDTLNRGIDLADRFIDGPADWQLFKNKKITYYFCPGKFFVSYASKSGDIFIPFLRLKNNTSPWLHETMHILLRSIKGNWNNNTQVYSYFYMPQWFVEGAAEYLAVKISHDNKIPKVDLFKSGGYTGVDSVCQKNLQKENGAYILKYIGTTGAMRELAGEHRADYAPTYYNCSCSFTKYLAESYGLKTILEGISAFEQEQETIERLTHKSMNQLKEEWVNQINQP